MAASLTAAILYYAGCKGRHYEPHFLRSCFLCNKVSWGGDTPFCGKECRQEQVEIDEAKEKSWKRSPVVAFLFFFLPVKKIRVVQA
ncbi:hypothetical protein ACJRO7_020434 [Eucalyptus globulus]|uniref:FLZ-type domain-containing protein n=1 Tax=Eucalyptus globulus TaxID=34317 RepID=A0ABD3KT73_EUCGL